MLKSATNGSGSTNRKPTYWRTWMLVLGMMILEGTLPHRARAEEVKTVEFPVLLVSTKPDGSSVGTLEKMTLELARTRREGPLQVAIVEETPSDMHRLEPICNGQRVHLMQNWTAHTKKPEEACAQLG